MSSLKSPEYWLCLERKARFGDTDAAGVLHFHNLFRWAHEAWEESLQQYGLRASQVFPQSSNDIDELTIALPIVQSNANYFLPIKTGDQLKIVLRPEMIGRDCFQVHTNFSRDGQDVAKTLIRHISIDIETRRRCPLSEVIMLWLEASALHSGIRPI